MKKEFRTDSHLERVLRTGQFTVTAELNPPDSADVNDVYRAATILERVYDGINVTDASGAHCHMSSVAMCALIIRACCEPVFQVSCRDRNRIAIQGDLLGAAAMGVHNVLCLTGDDVTTGDQPEAKRVFDLDSIQLLRVARIMCDQGKFMSGRTISTPSAFFLGAASNPFAQPLDWRPQRLAKKIEAGADFIQTQYYFDVARFRKFMDRIRDLGLHERAYILVGVGPLRSVRAAEYLCTKVPGVHMPHYIVDRLRKAPRGPRQSEGKRICIEIINQVREIEGVAGVHVMAYRQEELVAGIIEGACILPRPARSTIPGSDARESK